MSAVGLTGWKTVAVVTVLVAALLGGQALSDATVPADAGVETGRVVGRAGFAYLTGVRTAVAAMLWNRLEPQLHAYYLNVPLDEQTYMMPTIALVVALDPQFEQAYYVGSWVIARRGDVEGGLELARKGVENAPDSALLRANYAQMTAVFEGDYEAAAAQADIAMGLEWESPADQHTWYAMMRSIYKHAGRQDMVDRLGHELERLDAELGDALPAGAHDHDGDGVPDH